MPDKDPYSEATEAISTVALLRRAQEGDDGAREALVARCLPRLRRWARGRLPASARGLVETDDLVQDTLLSTLGRLGTFQPRQEGSIHSYLRQALLNRIRDEARRVSRRPAAAPLAEELPDESPSPLEQAVGREALARYEDALEALRAADREAVIGRLELQYSWAELALALGKPSPDAARLAVTRALQKLAEAMTHGH